MRLSRLLDQDSKWENLYFFRGLAILIVFLTHFEVIEFKGIAIDMFFVLSGFLILRSLLTDTSSHPTLNFLFKRVTKIVPSYYFFLIIGFIIAQVFVVKISPSDVPLLSEWKQYFFFYRNYGGPPPRWAFEHVWSLSVEEHFYFLIFLAAVLLRKTKHSLFYFKALVVGMIATGVLSKVQAIYTDFAEWPTYTHNRLDAFGWGGLLYFLISNKKYKEIFDRYILIFLSIVLLAITSYLDQSQHLLALRIVSPIACLLMIIGTMHIRIPFIKLFKILSFYSYSIYLWHFLFIIPIIDAFGHSILGFVWYIVSTALLSVITTHLVEGQSMGMRPKLRSWFHIQ